jgi:hypothetical protein
VSAPTSSVALVFAKARAVILIVVGSAALLYAVWPPDVEPVYVTLATSMLGLEPVMRANGKHEETHAAT